ncbi:transposase [Sphingobium indicum]|uniref:Transposase n=1 Tax=Sphingobium indicum TaxID=332055 RepID=A0A4Q4J998_9SPHN|nr:transposase [Sphingobium indicum]
MAARIAGARGGDELRAGDGRAREGRRVVRRDSVTGERRDRRRGKWAVDPYPARRERGSHRAGIAGRAGEGVIIPPGPLKVLVATQPVDFRKGMVGLASLVQRELRLDPFSGMLFIFRARRADRIKLLVWDGTGLVLVTKRLHDGKFRWPRPGDGVMKLSAAQASALVEGLDWSRVHVPRVPKPLHAQ